MSTPPLIKNRLGFKRQKLRKGTFSCWECKTRKIRCEFQSPNSSVCKSCQQRGLDCLSQEYVAVEGHGSDNVSQRIDDVETMVSQLLRRKRKTKGSFNGSGETQRYDAGDQMICSSYGLRTTQEISTLNINRSNLSAASIFSPSQQNLNGCLSLSQYLHSVMPKSSVTMMIFTQANYMQMPFQMFCRLRNTANAEDCDGQSPLVRASRKPPPTSHPVIFAQSLFKIALCMLQLEPATFYEAKSGLKEPVRDASRRLVEIAIKHVTSHDTLMHSLDGIETLMLESGYQFRLGDHYAAWLTLRRAIGLAELMGLRKMKHGDDGAESLWYLLNYSDRFVSAIFGLPCNSSDNSFASERVLAGKSAVERLGRIQVALLGRVIDRNIKMQCCNLNEYSDNEFHSIYEQTRGIDCVLKQSANILPVDPWVIPNLSSSATDKDVSRRTGILQVQMHHYYLILLLHQPYLLRTSCRPSERMHDSVDYRYSKLATLSASRDLLDRFLILRDIHHATAYGGLDHKAWLASATLLLAYINTHQSLSGETLEQQRLQDVAMIYRLVDRFRKTAYGVESVQQICTLLEMEANAANGEQYYFTWSENIESARVPDSLHLSIPYFGTVSVLSAKANMPPSWITSTNLPLTEVLSSDLTDYESFQDNHLSRSNLLAHSGLESNGLSQTMNPESFSIYDTTLLFDRTEDLSFESESDLHNPLAFDGDSGPFLRMHGTQPDM
jgi:hypothetical protein